MNNLETFLNDNDIKENEMIFVEPGQYGITNRREHFVVTNYTFSCTNLLVYTDHFAFLAHLFPSETLGRNYVLDERIDKIKQIINVFKKNITEVNVLIGLGISGGETATYHDLSIVEKKLKILEDFCSQNGINYIREDNIVSQFLGYDVLSKTLICDDNEKRLSY